MAGLCDNGRDAVEGKSFHLLCIFVTSSNFASFNQLSISGDIAVDVDEVAPRGHSWNERPPSNRTQQAQQYGTRFLLVNWVERR